MLHTAPAAVWISSLALEPGLTGEVREVISIESPAGLTGDGEGGRSGPAADARNSDLPALIGVAKFRPCCWPRRVARTIPMTSPFKLRTGPPLLPGFTGACIWMSPGLMALTIPSVTVAASAPRTSTLGKPITTTRWPSRTCEISPRGRGRTPDSGINSRSEEHTSELQSPVHLV